MYSTMLTSSQMIENISFIQKLHMPLCTYTPPQIGPRQLLVFLCLYWEDSLFLEFHISGIIKYVLFGLDTFIQHVFLPSSMLLMLIIYPS